MRLRRHLDLIILNSALLLVASVIGGSARALYRNSLAQHREWQSSKSLLSKQVMGAQEFVYGPQGLARNRLNLGVWWGFQEVLYNRSLNLAELDVAVCFEPDGYVYVLYDIRSDGFSGLRLSDRRDLPSIQFHASPDGMFLSVGGLALSASVRPNAVHSVRIRFERNRATVFLDGRSVGSFDREEGPQRIGFRGGQRAAWVDDVALHLADSTTVRESFSNVRGAIRRILVLFVCELLAVVIGGFLITWTFSVPLRSVGLGAVIVSMGLIVIASCAYALRFFSPVTYPIAGGQIKQAEETRMRSAQRQILAELQSVHSRPTTGGAYRILFLGSSQTWGAGASTADDTWVRQLEKMLNHDGRKRSFECVNASVSGLTSPEVLRILGDLLSLRPEAAVVTLSSNDVDTARFRASLDTMVVTLTRANIRTVLLLEPNSPERRITDSGHGDLAIKHRIVVYVGKAHGTPVIDLQRYLVQKNQTGFLWWDYVHLTSFGHRLVAEKLRTDLPTLLQLK